MSNELVPQFGNNELTLKDFAATVSYLPRLQLFTAKSDACTEGQIPINHYGLVLDQVITDLGEEIDVVLVHWRPKAVDVNGEIPTTSFNKDSDIFKEIVGRSETPNSGCMWGPEFLVWIPQANTFATLFMSSKSTRRESKRMQPYLRSAVTLKSGLIENNRYKWVSIKTIPCSTPVTMPPVEEIEKQYNSFVNPPTQEVEIAPEDDKAR